MGTAVSVMKDAFAALSSKRAHVPLRTHLQITPHNGVSLFMPAFVKDRNREALCLKAVSVFPENVSKNLPIIQAAVLLLEANTGRTIALIEGNTLTAIRTGAASGAATDLLARSDCSVAAIFGAGVQGRYQLRAISEVRSINTVLVYDPHPEKVLKFIDDFTGEDLIPSDIRSANDPREAVANADLICTATTSPTPVFNDKDLQPGVHINGVGSYTPEMQEIPSETVQRARVVVDSREAALAEAGDIIHPIERNKISHNHIHAEIGEIVLGIKEGRASRSQVTFFKSVGIAVQDAYAAQVVYENALKLDIGQIVDW
jgi:ornithine cyclodeaminase